jgi:hypothetical protein
MNTHKTTQFQLHQVHITSFLSNEMNRLGFKDAAATYTKVAAYLGIMHGTQGFKPEFWADYAHVATITAENLEGVFEVGNIGPEDKIKRHLPMHSVSVGDIVSLGGVYWMVEPCGYKEIEVGQEVARTAIGEVFCKAGYLPEGF